MTSWLKKIDKKMYSTCNKENLVLVKDLLELQRTKFISIWTQCQKMCILIN